MSDTILYEGKWLRLCERNDPDHGIKGYEFVHNVPGDGQGVAILPYRLLKFGSNLRIEFLVVNEIIPPWSHEPTMCSLTGLCDSPIETLPVTAARELKEEAGYTIDPSDLHQLGDFHISKSSDTKLTAYSVNLTHASDPPKPTGDGSHLESRLTTSWVKDPYLSPDPVLSAMWARIVTRLKLEL